MARAALVDVSDYIDRKLVHEIHTSERRSYRACRRRWDWLFRQNYYPKVTPKYFEFGSAYHHAMETYYNPATWDWDREVMAQQAILDFINYSEHQRDKAMAFQGRITLDEEVKQDYDERLALGKGMLEYYFSHVAPFADKGWKPVKVEIAFMVPIPNPKTGEDTIWCKCAQCFDRWLKANSSDSTTWTGLPVVYAGRIDMVAEDERGGYWIFDWKTTSRIAEDYSFLYLDDQVGSYPWALRSLGIPVQGFVYHEQRKAYPEPPIENKVVRLGRRFSVSKSQATSYDMYLKTVKEHDTLAYEAGLYDEFLAFLQAEGVVYFQRHQIMKSENELLEIERNIGLEALEMTAGDDLSIYPSAGRFSCGSCVFRQPCEEKNNRGDFQYALDTLFERREHYYVRQDPSTESKGGE